MPPSAPPSVDAAPGAPPSRRAGRTGTKLPSCEAVVEAETPIAGSAHERDQARTASISITTQRTKRYNRGRNAEQATTSQTCKQEVKLASCEHERPAPACEIISDPRVRDAVDGMMDEEQRAKQLAVTARELAPPVGRLAGRVQRKDGGFDLMATACSFSRNLSARSRQTTDQRP